MSASNFYHVPAMYEECMQALRVRPSGVYLDCTLGGAGHAEGILKRLTSGRLIANDLDLDAIANAKVRLAPYEDKVTYVHGDYKDILSNPDVEIENLDGIIIDMGLSSPQIDNKERGFSYMQDAPLDMRFNQEADLTARDIVNNFEEKELIDILFEYGEENLAKAIARAIVRAREKKPIERTTELSAIIEGAVGGKYRAMYGHPAKKTFQALRIATNNELDGLQSFIETLTLRLRPGGRIAVISFHSLEDRAVKRAFKELEKDCVCDKRMPICTCNKRKDVEILTPKPIEASEQEIQANGRAKSAKLRVAERV